MSRNELYESVLELADKAADAKHYKTSCVLYCLAGEIAAGVEVELASMCAGLSAKRLGEHEKASREEWPDEIPG
jgi:hypothetical protein